MKFRYLLYIGLVMAMLSLTSCSSRNSGTANVTIRYLNWEGSIAQIELMQKMVKEFNRTNPDIRVDLDTSAGTQKLLVQLAANSGPDVFYYCDVTSLARKGVLEPLDPYIKKHKYSLDGDFDSVTQAMKYKGKIYALPLNLSTICTVYNKNLFDKAGISYPKPGWTWDDYLQKAKALTVRDRRGVVSQFGTLMPGFTDTLYENGGMLAHKKNGRWVSDLRRKEAKDTVNYLLKVYEYAPKLVDKQVYGDSLGQLFQMGKVAMMPCPTAGLVGFFGKCKFDWDVVPIPDPPGKKTINPIAVGGMCVNARSRNKDAAFRFIAFYCSARGQKILAGGKNCLPSNKAVASGAFLRDLPAGASEYLKVAQGQTVVPASNLPAWDELMGQVITPNTEAIFYGLKKPDQALREMSRKVEAILSKSDKR